MILTLPSTGREVRVGKVMCIGKNYARHAAEMLSPVPTEPVVFLKPSTSLIRDQGEVLLPEMSQNVHHEVELVALVGRGGKNLDATDALDHVAGYAVGLDMTARDIQGDAKRRGHPWSVAKGFDTFAPLGAFAPAGRVPDPQDLTISLTVNGLRRQRGHTGSMVFSVATLIAFCSRVFTLEPGDLLFTGTPEGVGPVRDKDALEATCAPLAPLRVRVRR